jgi:hypothetical protein
LIIIVVIIIISIIIFFLLFKFGDLGVIILDYTHLDTMFCKTGADLQLDSTSTLVLAGEKRNISTYINRQHIAILSPRMLI